MRLHALALLILVLPSFARAQEPASYYAPWMDEEVDLKQIGMQPLRMEDLDGPLELTQNRTALEKAYAARLPEPVDQFGYDIFATAADDDAPKTQQTAKPTGLVGDDYILSAGDTLDITLQGQQAFRSTVTIDHKGQLILDNFPPIAAAARTLGEVRRDLESEASRLHNTEIYVSLSGIRQIGVLVVGHTEKPGRQTLTSFHTVLDAISEAGGIDKTGSLRQIKLIRSGKTYAIDLYRLLLKNGGRADMTLHDGDRIVVPPIGPTVAVSGFVKRPGIYEILPGEMLSLQDMLGLGGNVISPGKNRYIRLAMDENGEETVEDLDDKKSGSFRDGSILMVAQASAARTDDVTLSGHTREPGTHAFKRAKNLSDLISGASILGTDIYPLIGVIERKDPVQLTKTLLAFSPQQVLSGTFERKLSKGDSVYLFSATQIRNLKTAQNETLLHEASLTTPAQQDEQLQKPSIKDTHITDPLIASFLREREAFIRGAVRVPGAYPVADGTTLDNLLAVAGGLTLEAHQGNIEVTSRFQGKGYQQDGRSGTRRMTVNLSSDNPADIIIGAGDTIRVNQRFHRIEDQSVMILGEVAHPGRYDLMPGDTVLSLMERAGGPSAYAFPAGAIFSRATERKREEKRYRAQARDLEMKLAASLQSVKDDKKPDMAQVSAVQNLIAELKDAEAVGRITVEMDPGMLISDPELNMLLEAGDKIYIPKRPLTVRVAGEVLSPAALQFRKNKDAYDYINEAGGTTYYADKGRSFVIYPDGSAQPLHMSSWEHSAVMIPPGSTIIVPRDPEPFSFLDGVERISQIFANLAISGIYIDDLADD